MAKEVQPTVDPFYHHYPAAATVVTSRACGRDNAMAVAWHTAVSYEPPYYAVSISPDRFSHSLIVESGEFVINFVPYEQGNLVAKVAGCSGRDVDKFEAFQIERSAGTQVQAPVLAVAYAAYECRLAGRYPHGDHDLFVGEVLATHWEPTAFAADGKLDLERVNPLAYMGEDSYATATGLVNLDREDLVRPVLEALHRNP